MRLVSLLGLSVLLLTASAAQAADAPAKPNPNQACLDCHEATKAGEAGVRPTEFAKSVHGSFGCTDCHAGYEAPGPHELKPLDGADAALVKRMEALKASTAPRAYLACSGCHSEVTEAIAASAHGKWLKDAGAKAAGPTCAKCHGPVHEIAKVAEPGPSQTGFATAARAISKRCEACHDDAKLAEVAGISPEVVGTFHDSIHGRLVAVGSTKAPACADCHGTAEKDAKGVLHPNAHKILARADAASPVNPANKAQTCARCHAGANENFAKLITHRPPWESDHVVPHILHVAFSWLAALTLIFFAFHVVVDFLYELRLKFRKNAHAHHDASLASRWSQRFDIHQRIQHWFMLSGVIILGLTGWPLRGAGSHEAQESSRKIMALFGGPHGAALVHRIAAVMIIFAGAYHLLYLVTKASKRTLPLSMVPVPKDAFDMRDNLLHMLGLRPERPRFARYNYLEKFDYWAVFWGMIMMVGTGFVLWFPVFFAKYAPAWILTSAQIIHGEEATLAVLFLFVVHFYNAHLKPSIFPMSWVWLTGKISLEQMKEEHPAEFDKLREKEKAGKGH